MPVLLILAAQFALAAEPLASSPPAAAPLLTNGDFEVADPADPGRPLGWDKPDGKGVQWLAVPPEFDGAARGRALCLDTRVSEQDMVAQWQATGLTNWDIPKPAASPIALTYGLSYYSAAVPVVSGRTYRISFLYRPPPEGSGAKVWVRGYGRLGDRHTRLYEAIVNCRARAGQWTRFEQDFHPTRHRPNVTELRVMLYAYYPAGVYWFDDVALEILPEPPLTGGGDQPPE
jgi:hypothetical protein